MVDFWVIPGKHLFFVTRVIILDEPGLFAVIWVQTNKKLKVK